MEGGASSSLAECCARGLGATVEGHARLMALANDADQNGRPLWLVFALLKPINRLESRSLAENVASLRSVVLHEIIHGLGFSHSFFNYARDSEGRRRHLIALSRVYDADGEE